MPFDTSSVTTKPSKRAECGETSRRDRQVRSTGPPGAGDIVCRSVA